MRRLLISCSILIILFVVGCKTKEQPRALYYQPVFDQTKKEYVKIPSPKGVELDTTVLIRPNIRDVVEFFSDTVNVVQEFEICHGELIVPVELINEKPPTFDTVLIAKEYLFKKEHINLLFPIIPELVKSELSADSGSNVQPVNLQDFNFAAETFDTSSTNNPEANYDADRIEKLYSQQPSYLAKAQILSDSTRDLFEADSILTSLIGEAAWKIGDSIPAYSGVSHYDLDSILYLKLDTLLVKVYDPSKIVPRLPFKKMSKEVCTKMVIQEPEIISGTVTFRVFYPDEEDVFIRMVRVEGGEFKLGNNEFDEDERPATKLTVSRFLLSKYEVTNKLFCFFLNDIECDSAGDSEGLRVIDLLHPATKIKRNKFTGKFSPRDGFDDFPVVNVSWAGVQLFCKEFGGRLPSEAEWEYAAKGGVYAIKYYIDANKTDYDYEYRFAGGNYMGDLGWFVDNSGGDCRIGGRFKPNALGLYDMSGNVWEWCYDKYSKEGYYAINKSKNPMNIEGSTLQRVNRGGSWSSDAQYCRICNRNYLNQYEFNPYLGFRYMREWK